jgi:hypothetical protein
MRVRVIKSPDRTKKFRAILEDGRTVNFGASGYSDYTKHKDPKRMRSYIARHGAQNQNWTIRGIATPGFWSRWYLWSHPTIEGARKHMTKKFGLLFNSD